MKVVILSLRYREAHDAKAWLERLPGKGTAYLTDQVTRYEPAGGRVALYPGGRLKWQELQRPGDIEEAELAASLGFDLLYKFPSRGRRRLFVNKN